MLMGMNVYGQDQWSIENPLERFKENLWARSPASDAVPHLDACADPINSFGARGCPQNKLTETDR